MTFFIPSLGFVFKVVWLNLVVALLSPKCDVSYSNEVIYVKSNFLYYFVSVCLILVGVIIAPVREGNCFNLAVWSNTLGMIADLATISGVVIACYALNSWRTQYAHTKLDSLIDDLEDSFGKLYRSIHKYRFAQIMIEKYRVNPSAQSDYQQLEEQCDIHRDDYFEQRERYSEAFERLSRHCKIKKDSMINAENIARQVVPVLQELRNIYGDPDIRREDDLLQQNEQLLETMWAECKQEYRNLREMCC